MFFLNNRIYRLFLNNFVMILLKYRLLPAVLLYDNTIDNEYYTRYNACIKETPWKNRILI